MTKLKEKVDQLEQAQKRMKAVNAYYWKNKTLDGCLLLEPEELERLKTAMVRSWRASPKPYESYVPTNNNAAIRVTDFTQMEQLREDPEVTDILSRISREIGLDCVRVLEQADGGRQILSTVSFAEWDNPYFSSATLGRIAAQYYELLHRCCPLPRDKTLRGGEVTQIVQFIQREGKTSVSQLKLAVATLAASFSDNVTVQELARLLTDTNIP